MGSSLRVPGGLGGFLLGQADSFALKVRSLPLSGVQDPSNQCLLQVLPGGPQCHYKQCAAYYARR
jgi:hypothetical protein